MSTEFFGEGNIGTVPEVRTFDADGETRQLVLFNVFFDNSFRDADGEFKDRGGFWSRVEIWTEDAGQLAALYQRGMRVMVHGRMRLEKWKTKETGEDRQTLTIASRRVGILPSRIDKIVMKPRAAAQSEEAPNAPATEGNAPAESVPAEEAMPF